MNTLLTVIFRSFLVVLALLLVFAAILFFVQDGMIYFARPYKVSELKAMKAKGMVELGYTSGQGKQVAWFVPPRSSGNTSPRIWIVFGGNGGRAADYRDLASDVNSGYLFIDYPGYGLCEGKPNPGRIDESVDAALVALASHLGVSGQELKPRLCVVGHSLGAAVGLRAAVRHEIDEIVVLAPFTTMKEMAASVVGKTYSNVLRHRFDNVTALSDLQEHNPNVRVKVLSGTADREVPHSMSKELADRFPDIVELEALNGIGHNDILDEALFEVLEAMKPSEAAEK